MNVFIDTNVLIDYMRGKDSATVYLTERFGFLHVSIIVYMELVQGFKKKQEIQSFTELSKALGITLVHLNKAASEICFRLFKENYHSFGIGIEDALIASSAIEAKLPLVTLNLKHFDRLQNLELIQPY